MAREERSPVFHLESVFLHHVAAPDQFWMVSVEASMPARMTFVTGASGFVGRALCTRLVNDGLRVRANLRSPAPDVLSLGIEPVFAGSLTPQSDWMEALAGIDTVVHLAARVHVMHERATDALSEFRYVNVASTEHLARVAAHAGVRRFIYMSTIKVNGEATASEPFREDDLPCPSDPYSISKWEAEQGLRRIASETGMEIVIIRPPLVYGPGVGGNFLTILKWVDRGIPLPLASVHNRRSLIGLTNLVSLIAICLSHPRAAGEVFLVSDGEDLSTPDLFQRVARALGKRSTLFPLPVSLLRAMARILGKSSVCERLCGSLKVDSSKARRLLDWIPSLSVDAELQATSDWYRHRISKNIALS